MLFNELEFLLTFGALLAFLATVRANRPRKLVLLAYSYYFYAYWDYRFLALILFSTAVDYIIARRMHAETDPGRRRSWMLASLLSNLGLLGFFKYCNFFLDSLGVLLAPLGLELGTLAIILPVGISFYTFQTLSYSIDVYRGRLEPCDDFFDFALFVAFFPQLVAGPIVRASAFLPQLEAPRALSWERAVHGGRQFTIGLFKKVFLADNLATFVDTVFANAGAFDGATTWLAALCFGIQIYCDFSGYSDMAIGAARVMGYDFERNFNWPYHARSLTEFWRRWHISLSTWLRDYLYISLGGNRAGTRQTYWNLMLTMLLGGLWHGAAWTFLFWGALHGAVLAIERALGVDVEGHEQPETSGRLLFLRRLFTLLVVIVAWVFFRSTDGGFTQALLMLEKMFVSWGGVAWYPPQAVAALAVVLGVHFLPERFRSYETALPVDAFRTPVVLVGMLWLVVVFQSEGFQPFVYFQF